MTKKHIGTKQTKKPILKFIDFKRRVRNKPTCFQTNNYEYKYRMIGKKHKVRMQYAVAKSPSGVPSWRVIGRAKK